MVETKIESGIKRIMCCTNGCDCCKHCCGVDQDHPCPKGCPCANSSVHTTMEVKVFGFHNQKPVFEIIDDMIKECGDITDDLAKRGAVRSLEELARRAGKI